MCSVLLSFQCVFQPGQGWTRGGYQCVCRRGFYSLSQKGVFNGTLIEGKNILQNVCFPVGSKKVIIRVVVFQRTRQAMYVKRNIEARPSNHCCRGKARIITRSECISVALVIKHEKLMRLVIFSSVPYLAVRYFPPFSVKRHNFRKLFIEHKIC